MLRRWQAAMLCFTFDADSPCQHFICSKMLETLLENTSPLLIHRERDLENHKEGAKVYEERLENIKQQLTGERNKSLKKTNKEVAEVIGTRSSARSTPLCLKRCVTSSPPPICVCCILAIWPLETFSWGGGSQEVCDIPEPQSGHPAIAAGCSDHKWTSHNDHSCMKFTKKLTQNHGANCANLCMKTDLSSDGKRKLRKKIFKRSIQVACWSLTSEELSLAFLCRCFRWPP